MNHDIVITLSRGLKIYIDVENHPLATKWYSHLEDLIKNSTFLEKNFCFLGFPNSLRNGSLICNEITSCITQINTFFQGRYLIEKEYTIDVLFNETTNEINQDNMNWLHRHFEELQLTGTYFKDSDPKTRLAIRRLNLLCHEFESWIRAHRKSKFNLTWVRSSQIMCFMHSLRFKLEEDDYDGFGINALRKTLGGVYVGVNKDVGKTHFEVFTDEKAGDIDALITTALKPQSVITGDFDIEWSEDIAFDPEQLKEFNLEVSSFTKWLTKNGFDPNNQLLGIGTPKVGQVDLFKSFGTTDSKTIRVMLEQQLNVVEIKTKNHTATYPLNWDDATFDLMCTKLMQ